MLPAYGVGFADVPNGLKALSKVPAIGWCHQLGSSLSGSASLKPSLLVPSAAAREGLLAHVSSMPISHEVIPIGPGGHEGAR